MVSQLKVNEIIKQSGSSISIGESGDTITLPSSATLTNFPDNTPSFLVTRSGAQSIADSSTTKIQWNSEIFDTDNTFDSSTNYRFTPGVAGKYVLAAGTRASSFETGEKMQLFFYKNGSGVSYQTETRTYSASGGGETLTVDAQILVESDADDYFEVFLLQNEGGSRDIGSASYFYGYKLIGA